MEASENFKGEGEDGVGGRDGRLEVGVFVVMKVRRLERASLKVCLVSWVMAVGMGVEILGRHWRRGVWELVLVVMIWRE